MSNERKNKGQSNPSPSPKQPPISKTATDAPVTATNPNRPANIKPVSEAVSSVPAPKTKFFRKWDWIAFAITTLVVFCGYFYTLAPDVTLEDSGELAVASFYAGVPHPPGYPVWTLYTWLFTVLFPFSNIAWRVALSSAVAGAFSCGLLAMLVSRGSSLAMEAIQEFKSVTEQQSRWITLVAGFAAGVLMGFNGFMWSQAVIVEVYPLSVLSLMLVLCWLLRWVYAPQQRRYLYYAAFMFGICLNNHQTLIVATMGIEILIMAVQPKLGRDLLLINTAAYLVGLYAKSKGIITSFDGNPVLFGIFNAVGLGSALAAAYIWAKTKKVFTEWRAVIIICLGFATGLAFYFYMPISSMTNPPMNWGYPRTEQGFWHALTRGQYDKTNPSNPLSARFLFDQLPMYFSGAIEEFNIVNLMIGLVPFLYYKRLLKRDRAWLVGLTAIYCFLAFLLLILLNPQTDRQAREQARVFFAASFVIIAIAIGYGLAIIGTLVATQYEKVRNYLWIGASVAAAVAFYALFALKSQFRLDLLNSIFILCVALAAVAIILIHKQRAPLYPLLAIFAIMPIYTVLAHWSDNEQRGHVFGYWFGHDMFTPPYGIYPEMTKNAILFGGTDPGRFNPTYMIFCESFIPPSKKPRDEKFNRRDVYLITQNALADGTYLDYIRAHYNRSAQHDPYFFSNFLRTTREEERGTTNIFARMAIPLDKFLTKWGAGVEKRRRAEGVYPPKENPPPPPPDMVNNPYDVGAYLSKEIYTPSVEDSQHAFSDYIQDAQRRLQHDMQFPNEPKQIKPGEDVRIVDNRVSVSGQVAVMAINGLLTKVIFDKNPTNEFFVEESFPLDWMYPHLTPFGIIMKINRNPVPEITQEMVDKDHKFWSQYSDRLIGNWITYDTPVKDICDFALAVYRRREVDRLKGTPELTATRRAFVRDDNAQKAFSKLRSAIGGVYFWRVQNSKSPAENARMLKEAEFAFKQSFAFCPYSPEAVYKYVTLLVNLGRTEDAERVAKTCIEFDPENLGMIGLAQNLAQMRQQSAVNPAAAPGVSPQVQLANIEAQYKANPTNLQVAFQLASLYFQLQRSNDGLHILQSLIANTNADAQTIMSVAQAYAQLGNNVGVEHALEQLVRIMPTNPEGWYDLARAQIGLQKIPQGLASLQKAVELSNARLKLNPQAPNIAKEALTNANLAPVRNLPEFLKIVGQQ
jgi:tetratricopeptide (TPR) repeat protein